MEVWRDERRRAKFSSDSIFSHIWHPTYIHNVHAYLVIEAGIECWSFKRIDSHIKPILLTICKAWFVICILKGWKIVSAKELSSSLRSQSCKMRLSKFSSNTVYRTSQKVLDKEFRGEKNLQKSKLAKKVFWNLPSIWRFFWQKCSTIILSGFEIFSKSFPSKTCWDTLYANGDGIWC